MKLSNVTSEQLSDLKLLHKQTKERRSADKIKAILLMHAHYSQREIAAILLIDEDTVTAWKNTFTASNTIAEYLTDAYVPYQGKLTLEEKKKVETFTNERVVSSAGKVLSFIKETFKKVYSSNGCMKLLNRLGFSYKQTTLIPAKYNLEKQQQFIEQYHRMEENLGSDEVILFVDGVHPQHNTVSSHAWIKRGLQKLIKSNTGRTRLNINGAYNPKTQEVIVHEDQTLNAQTTMTFFDKVQNYYPDKKTIYAIVDNARYYKNKDLQHYQAHSRIKLMFLPSYSPNLNLIERLWKFMRKQLINSHYYETFKEFKASVLGFFEHIADYKQQLKQFIGTKFHLLATPNNPKTNVC